MTARTHAGSLIKKSTHFALALAVFVLTANAPAHAASLDEVIGGITTQVSNFLRSKNESSISIGAFDGPPTTGTGRKIASDIKRHLEESGLTITDNALEANFELRGEFRQNLDGPFPIVALTVKLFDSNGAEVTSFRDRFRESTQTIRQEARDNLDSVAQARSQAAEETAGETAAQTPSENTDEPTSPETTTGESNSTQQASPGCRHQGRRGSDRRPRRCREAHLAHCRRHPPGRTGTRRRRNGPRKRRRNLTRTPPEGNCRPGQGTPRGTCEAEVPSRRRIDRCRR